MRYIRLVHFVYMGLLFLLDFIFQSIIVNYGVSSIHFVSQLHFVGLLLMARNDTYREILLRGALACFFLDLIHYESYPVLYFSYLIALVVVRFWYKHIGTSYFESLVMIMVGFFIKELILWMTLHLYLGFNSSLHTFISLRSMWIVLGNALIFPLAAYFLQKANHRIVVHTQQHYR